MTGYEPHCIGNCTTACGCYYSRVQSKRYTLFAGELPTIPLSELNEKQLQTGFERNAFVVHRCTVPQIILSPFFILMNIFLIFIVTA
jgi:hypothetical protein